MTEKIVGNCPYCGKEIEIPLSLQEFSCLYCGKRSHIDLLHAQQDFRMEDLMELASQLPQTLREHDSLYKHINRKEYIPRFQSFEAEHSALLKRIDTLIFAAPMDPSEVIEQVCAKFLNTMEENLKELKEYHTNRGRSNLLFEIKIVLALFLTPLTGKLALRMAEPFCSTLHAQWMKRYPKEPWYPGNYDNIAGGFRKKKLCFITTAVCSHEGKGDDCVELTTLRSFRDGWLHENGGDALIREYYEIAPTLVTLMDHCDASHICYDEIRTRWIEPCLTALKQGQKELCRDTYVDMVQTLRRRYLQ